MRHVRALEGAVSGRRGGPPAPRLPRAGGRPHLRRARGAGHPLLRGRGPLGAQQGAEGVADAVPLDDQPVQGLHPCVHLLLRPPHPHLPRLRRRPRLRARDRGQGQHARAGAGRAVQAVVEARARRARHQHRSVPVGREEVRAAAGRLGGHARLRHALLGAHQVAAAPARHRAVQADPGLRRQPLRSRPSTRRPGAPASRTRRTRASGSRPWPSSTGPASPPAC